MSFLATMSQVDEVLELQDPLDALSIYPEDEDEDDSCDGMYLYTADEDQSEGRPIDQVYCTGCGRTMVIWADEALKHTECGRCQRGLPPEWEF